MSTSLPASCGYAPPIDSSPVVFAVHVALYCAFPFFLATRASERRQLLFSVYVGILVVYSALLGPTYALRITDGISISGGSIAYAAVMMTVLLLFLIERDVDVVRSMLLAVLVAIGFDVLLFLLVGHTLGLDDVSNPLGVSEDVYGVSARVVLVGGLLIAVELVAILAVLEAIKSRVPVGLLPVAIGTVFAGVLVLDGVLFPVLALPFDDAIDGIGAGVSAKLVLALTFGVPVTAYLFLSHRLVGQYHERPIRVRDVFDTRASLVGKLELQRRELDDSTERYRHLAESVGDVFLALDEHLRCTYCNAGAAALLGRATETAVGASLDTLLPDEAGSELDRFLRTAHAQRRAERHVGRLRGDPARRWFEFAAYPSDVGMTVLARDVTDRERTREALEVQSTALNAAANPMLITDELGFVQWSNAEFCLISGYDSDELIGMSAQEILRSDRHDPATYDAIWDTILTGSPWRGELTTSRRNGEHREVELTITPVSPLGRGITHFIAVARDLTERNHLQAQVVQAQKMETVGRLAGGIAHDFNNLLTVINGMAEIAMLRVQPDDELVGDLRQIQLAGDRAATLTRQLLDFSRRRITSPELLDLAEIVDDLRPILQRVLGDRIELIITHGGRASVRADRGQLEQVVMNLVVNSRDAMTEGGTLTISTAVVDHSPDRRWAAATSGPQVVLSVTDTGTGMDAVTAARVFEPFFTTKDASKGTGLGLATVYGIVQHSGGTIDVQSGLGNGTTFTITLPRVEMSLVESTVDSRPTGAPGTGTVLLVEDEDAVRHLVAEILSPMGYDVHSVADAEAALEVLASGDLVVDLLLTDVVLPGMSGVALAERAAQTHPDLRVLFTSGYTDDDILRRGVRNRAVRFIAKPFTVTDLRRAVQDALEID